MDLPDAQAAWPKIARALKKRGHEAMSISAATGEGVQTLLRQVAVMLRELPVEPVAPPEPKVFRPKPDEDAFEVLRENDYWRVRGAKVERNAAMTDWKLDEAVLRFQRILDAMGITDALREAGAKSGDTVVIGDAVLEWQ
jgi:GTP-binding protein